MSLMSASILVLGIPPALVAYWFWRREFRRAWVDDNDIPEGVSLANDDWKVGLAFVVFAGIVMSLLKLTEIFTLN